jgi:hypothetical protein
MTKEAYVPQSYPLFVALDRVELPGNIRELDIYDAKAVVRDAISQRQLDIQRVVAWLIEDEPDRDGFGVFAKPITVRGFGNRWTVAETPDGVRTVAETPDGVRKAMEERCMDIAGWTPKQVGQGLDPNGWTKKGYESTYG